MLTGEIMMMNLEPTQTIKDIKLKIQDDIGIHPDQIKLIFSGQILKNSDTVEKAKLSANKQIHMVLNLRGGL